MSLIDKLVLKINSIDDLLRCITLSSLLELSGWPKAGNVHRTRNFETTRYEHFLAGICAIQPNFRIFCEKVYKKTIRHNEKCDFIELGSFFEGASKEMMEWQKGGNVLLGHVLILAPLAGAAARCVKLKEFEFANFIFHVSKIIEDATVEDTIKLYSALKRCNPGGMGKKEKYDIYDENSLQAIRSDYIYLKKIFEYSKEYDTISLEYSNGFNITLNEGLPYFLKVFEQTKDINITIVNTFLLLLAKHPDTLIIRKSGKEAALMISNRALEIINHDGILTEIGYKLNNELDEDLQNQKGKMNPGTTADILTGVICCALLCGLKF